MRRDARNTLETIGEGVIKVLGALLNIVMAIWGASGFLFFAYWVIASIVVVFLGND